jgi:ArsR family metal-binding transcriptional regulator
MELSDEERIVAARFIWDICEEKSYIEPCIPELKRLAEKHNCNSVSLTNVLKYLESKVAEAPYLKKIKTLVSANSAQVISVV